MIVVTVDFVDGTQTEKQALKIHLATAALIK